MGNELQYFLLERTNKESELTSNDGPIIEKTWYEDHKACLGIIYRYIFRLR